MSFLIKYEKNLEGWKCSSRINERKKPTPSVLSNNKHKLLLGWSLEKSAEEILACGWESDPKLLNNESLAVAAVSFENTGCTFVVNSSGTESIFYYWRPESDKFLVSDNYWEIVEDINPSINDLNVDAIEEMIACYGKIPGSQTTPIKNLYHVYANAWGRFDAVHNRFAIDYFEPIRRSGTITNINEAVEQLDYELDRVVEAYSNLFGDCVYGLGLSGGLDSRVALHYLVKHGLRVTCFNEGTKKPNGILDNTGLIRARKIAESYGMELHEIAWNPQNFAQDLELAIQQIPFGNPAVAPFKYEKDCMPDYDVLVTGGWGIGQCLVGYMVPSGSNTWSAEKTLNYLLMCEIQNMNAKSLRGVDYLRRMCYQNGINISDVYVGPNQDLWDSIVPETVISRIEDRMAEFVVVRYDNGWLPGDIYLNYEMTYWPLTMRGAAETRLAQDVAFGIYGPYLVKRGLDWNTSICEDRRVLKELIIKKIPELGEIGDERWSSLKEERVYRKLIDNFIYLLRGPGHGNMAVYTYSRNKYLYDQFIKDFNNESEWFYEIFPETRKYEEIWKLSPMRKISLWFTKCVVDYIEKRTYRKYILK